MRLRLRNLRQSHQDLHFQPEAGNEILNQFGLKLTPVEENNQCPMPNAQCPMPNAQCPMPNAQCPMPNAQCPMH
ncbi:hypothetical protein [Nostoc sp.]